MRTSYEQVESKFCDEVVTELVRLQFYIMKHKENLNLSPNDPEMIDLKNQWDYVRAKMDMYFVFMD